MWLIRKKAFTLVELLVVISIIAMLMAILLPSLGRAREQAERTVCMANLRSIGQGLHTYANDNDDRLVPGDFCVAWGVWGWRTEGPGSDDKTYKEVNLGHLLASRTLPIPDRNNNVLFCPSSRGPDGDRPLKDFKQGWGSENCMALITYMFNDALDGFTNYVQQGNQAVLSHRDKINFLIGDGSVQVFKVKPMIFDDVQGPELLHEVSARYGVCFPAIMLNRWLEKDEVDVSEAKDFLRDPQDWANYQSVLYNQQHPREVLIANLGTKSLVCDVAGVWSGPQSTPPHG